MSSLDFSVLIDKRTFDSETKNRLQLWNDRCETGVIAVSRRFDSSLFEKIPGLRKDDLDYLSSLCNLNLKYELIDPFDPKFPRRLELFEKLRPFVDCGPGDLATFKEKLLKVFGRQKIVNEKNTQRVRDALLAMDYGIIPVKTVYGEESEESFFVFNRKQYLSASKEEYYEGSSYRDLRNDLFRLAIEFEQESITYAPENGPYLWLSCNSSRRCLGFYAGGFEGMTEGESFSLIRQSPYFWNTTIDYSQIKQLPPEKSQAGYWPEGNEMLIVKGIRVAMTAKPHRLTNALYKYELEHPRRGLLP